ncbi:MAG: hypothetical protein ABF811_06750 [Pseudoclavibacter sp.]
MAEQEHRLTRREMRARERAAEQRTQGATEAPVADGQPSAPATAQLDGQAAVSAPLVSGPLLGDETPQPHHSHHHHAGLPEPAPEAEALTAAGPAAEASAPAEDAPASVEPAAAPVVSDESAGQPGEVAAPLPPAGAHRKHRHRRLGSGPQAETPAEQSSTPVAPIPAAKVAAALESAGRASSAPVPPVPVALGNVAEQPIVPHAPAAPAPQPVPEAFQTPSPDQRQEGLEAVGSTAPPTASVLILPQVPHADLTKPLDETGEVVLTGSITLPSITSRTGRIPFAFEKDQGSVREDAASMIPVQEEAQPIRALDMVSRYQQEPVLPTARRSGVSRAGIVLVIVSATMLALAIGIAALTIIGSR